MMDDELKGSINLQYKPAPEPALASTSPRSEEPRPEVGPSSLVGRRGDNMTFHTQGAQKQGYTSLLWNWAWKDLAATFFGLLRLFTPSKRK